MSGFTTNAPPLVSGVLLMERRDQLGGPGSLMSLVLGVRQQSTPGQQAVQRGTAGAAERYQLVGSVQVLATQDPVERSGSEGRSGFPP
jgi:hypothetical protein